MTDTAAAFMKAAQTLLAELSAAEDPPTGETIDLEALEVRYGTVLCVAQSPSLLRWALTTPTGARATGYVQTRVSAGRVEIFMDGKPTGLYSLDWDTHLADMSAAVHAAVQSKPGWSALRAHLIKDAIRFATEDLVGDVTSAMSQLEELTTHILWDAVANEPDRDVAAVAEQTLGTGFTGTAEELLRCARAATGR